MQRLYKTETQAYNTLADMQGNDIPRLFSCVTVPSSTPAQNTLPSEYIDIPGILLQYLVGDRGILNKDVKKRSFVVQSRPENQFHVFIMDFALCNFREEYQDETEWEEWKATQDEEGAVGYVMQKKLQGGSVYHRCARYNKLDEKYMMEG